jgi:crossover junction endodeoxyribonuclease RuvC
VQVAGRRDRSGGAASRTQPVAALTGAQAAWFAAEQAAQAAAPNRRGLRR